jgi:hypothetical protein
VDTEPRFAGNLKAIWLRFREISGAGSASRERTGSTTQQADREQGGYGASSVFGTGQD